MRNGVVRLIVCPGCMLYIHLQTVSNLDDSAPCVALASPGMLQSGASRDLFERWCQDARNSIIIAGYAVQGTLAKDLLDEPKEVTSVGEYA